MQAPGDTYSAHEKGLMELYKSPGMNDKTKRALARSKIIHFTQTTPLGVVFLSSIT